MITIISLREFSAFFSLIGIGLESSMQIDEITFLIMIFRSFLKLISGCFILIGSFL